MNIGKQRETPLERAAEDYVSLMERFAPLADYLAVNISSPGTPGLRRLQQREWLEPLLEQLTRRRAALGARLRRRVPLLVKLAPDLSDAELDSALEAIAGTDIDGLIATNTTTSREGLQSPHRGEKGGLSGSALTDRSTRLVRAIVERTGGELPVIACGGVMGPADARSKLDAGASLVQLYTGLVFEGPGLVKRILDHL